MAAAAPLLKGPTHIYGIAHTRKQETDRVHAMATELRKLGQRVDETEDSLRIVPDLDALKVRAVKKPEIETYSDHRVAMSFGILVVMIYWVTARPGSKFSIQTAAPRSFLTFL